MIGKWSVVIEKNILKVCVVLAFCCMVLLQNNVYGATTENGSRSNPYLVQTESKLKNIFRQSLLSVDNRRENDAEHSWHLCMYAVVLEEYAPEGTDLLRAIKMMLVHDLVEIYAGDTYLYDVKGNETKAQRESEAAEKLYAILDKEQCEELKGYWLEFERNDTPEAKFANSLDRLQPIMLNYITRGEKWLVNHVTKAQVIERGSKLTKDAHPALRKFVLDILDESVEKGYLLP